jgi:hypothetical protein
MTVPSADAPNVLHGPPPPPPGPGVAPPFAAPPTDRDNKGLWIGLSAGALLLVLCCVGGIGGIVLLSADGGLAKTQAVQVVSGYLDALMDEDYGGAYDLLCEEQSGAMSRTEFRRLASRNPIESYEVGDVTVQGQEILVEVRVKPVSGTAQTGDYRVVQESTELKVCPPL